MGDKWSMLVTRALADGDARYSDLDTEIPAIPRRMLTLTLKRLERSGLVDRTAHAEVPPRVVYSLTSLGASLVSAVEHLAAWCVEQHAEIRRHQDAYDKSATRNGPWQLPPKAAEPTAITAEGRRRIWSNTLAINTPQSSHNREVTAALIGDFRRGEPPLSEVHLMASVRLHGSVPPSQRSCSASPTMMPSGPRR
ncbi:helix-turn-helix domain-containing protein [Streptomyces mirabilis]|uniref:winged helix-turn-helix transcriptional regulator n=1 Tax=Streptomyces sp. NPDC005388 TaxID=3156717 RepID=UPI0033AC12E9